MWTIMMLFATAWFILASISFANDKETLYIVELCISQIWAVGAIIYSELEGSRK